MSVYAVDDLVMSNLMVCAKSGHYYAAVNLIIFNYYYKKRKVKITLILFPQENDFHLHFSFI